MYELFFLVDLYNLYVLSVCKSIYDASFAIFFLIFFFKKKELIRYYPVREFPWKEILRVTKGICRPSVKSST